MCVSMCRCVEVCGGVLRDCFVSIPSSCAYYHIQLYDIFFVVSKGKIQGGGCNNLFFDIIFMFLSFIGYCSLFSSKIYLDGTKPHPLDPLVSLCPVDSSFFRCYAVSLCDRE